MQVHKKRFPHRELPVPTWFDPGAAANWTYRPDAQRLMRAAADHRRAHGIRASAADRQNLHLLLIDVQKDFCFPEGTLFVGGRSGTGAIDDSRRLAEFIYRNLGSLTNITTTMDPLCPSDLFSRVLGRSTRGSADSPPRDPNR